MTQLSAGAAGAAAAAAAGGDPPPTPPAAGGDPPNPAEGTPPAGFDWAQPLPGEGVPQHLSMYKTFNDVSEAHKSLKGELTTKGNELSQAKKDLEAANASLAKASEGQLTEAQQRSVETRQVWGKSIDHYFTNEAISEDLIGDLQERTGLGRQEILDVHEQHLQKRTTFLERTASDYPGTDVKQLESWVREGHSPFPHGVIEGFYWLADHGYIGWVDLVQKQYDQYIEGGGQVPQQGRQPAPGELRRGRPAGGGGDGFKSRADYQEAYSAAKASGDAKAEAEVMRRLEVSKTESWG